MTSDPPETRTAADPAARRRRIPWLMLAVAVACVAAGVVLVEWLRRPDAPPAPPLLPGDGRYDRQGPPGDNPAGWLSSRPADVGGFVEVAALPADVPMPGGAKRQSLVGRRDDWSEWIKAEYLADGALADVTAEMDRALAGAGWRQAKGQTDRTTATRVWCKEARVLSVRLHWRADSVKIVAIVQQADPRGLEHR